MQAIAVLALPLALWLDRVAGEPPARLHPVVAMGRWLALAGPRVAPPAGQGAGGRWRIAAGGLAWGAGALAFGLAAWGAQRWLATLPVWLALPLLVLLLKPMFAWRMLADEVRAVENALAQSLDAGRARLAWLVSRDVAALDAAGVRESAIETLAENLNDSVVAPLFWFAVAGLPGAVVYRYANTADAMWGYRGERGGRDWTRAGRVAARVDDALSWLPARLTALLLWLAAGLARCRRAARPMRRPPRAASAWRSRPRRRARRRPTAAGRWARWRCCSACGCASPAATRSTRPDARRSAPTRCARCCWRAGRGVCWPGGCRR
ncbi:CobD/CbiB family cobalamin biosynthesis protein [Derxia gummosa]|uniref:Cobalamin biosynthesis protein CobD n=1 Tax=Derxia gummosa DSM 723 TaxID=1121388 RepID=A0ABD8HQB0_9BURK